MRNCDRASSTEPNERIETETEERKCAGEKLAKHFEPRVDLIIHGHLVELQNGWKCCVQNAIEKYSMMFSSCWAWAWAECMYLGICFVDRPTNRKAKLHRTTEKLDGGEGERQRQSVNEMLCATLEVTGFCFLAFFLSFFECVCQCISSLIHHTASMHSSHFTYSRSQRCNA